MVAIPLSPSIGLDPEGEPALDPGALRDGHAVEVFLAKLSWWWG